MAIFKCKMCGGTIEFKAGDTVGVCDSCGTKQTLPRLDDDKRANLYDRANHYRRSNDFDKAISIYEQILDEDGTDAEAYWSLVLCRYGIEYVEDPVTRKRVPTVNRAQFTSIYMDEDYKSALKYASFAQKTIYEQEAAAIDTIQKGILEISSKEEPFDVFICYKETDETGRRTRDSVLATELYHELTTEGFKVFFSRITLEDKLGVAYEPYIFAALNSAKVMVVIGTKPEYFNAVWVKNEWSRYLALVKQSNGKKVLIPAYRDMDPYDLPEEFSHLQAQDMSKLGFMQDLIRGVKKIVNAVAEKETVVKETVVVSGTETSSIEPILERAFMFLEDGNFLEADRYCERVLDMDPKNARAYLGKLMAELNVRRIEDLNNCSVPFGDNVNYQKAIRFGDDELRVTLAGYCSNADERHEAERKDLVYTSAKEHIASVTARFYSYADVNKCRSAIELFETIRGWRDSDKQIEICRAKIARMEVIREEEERNFVRKKRRKRLIISSVIVTLCALVVAAVTVVRPLILSGKYNKAVKLYDDGNVIDAYEKLIDLKGYKDSAEKADAMFDEYKIEKLKAAKVGDYVFWGTYEQDNDTSNGKENIEWLVLAVEDGKALLISRYAIDNSCYNDSDTDVTWETCSLRKWLNETFINDAFSAEEEKTIKTSTVLSEEDPFSSNPGKDVQDKVFLLSSTEVATYFSNADARRCAPTDYAKKQGAPTGFFYKVDHKKTCTWWLRSLDSDDKAVYIYYDGKIYYNGYIESMNGVRPAMWVDLTI